MVSSWELRNKREKYYTLLDNVNSLKRQVNSAASSVSSASVIGDYFAIDGMSADNNTIKNVSVDIDNILQEIDNRIIPGINNKISYLNREIERAEEAEAEGL